MALTLEQENALLALLDEPLVTLNELPKAVEIDNDDLFLTRQDTTERAVTGEVMKDYFAAPATLEKRGTVQLTNDANSDSEEKAVTPKGVKTSLVNYLPLSGGTLTSYLTVPQLRLQSEYQIHIPFFDRNDQMISGIYQETAGDLCLFTSQSDSTNGTLRITPNGHINISGNTNILPVGVPQPWPHETPPSGWFKCNGAAFDKQKYPALAQAYPSGVLPDLRGEFIRGWDDGRGIDTGREILSWQEDAIQKIYGNIYMEKGIEGVATNGVFTNDLVSHTYSGHTGSSFICKGNIIFDSSRVTRAANETRPRNVAFLYIVRAA